MSFTSSPTTTRTQFNIISTTSLYFIWTNKSSFVSHFHIYLIIFETFVIFMNYMLISKLFLFLHSLSYYIWKKEWNVCGVVWNVEHQQLKNVLVNGWSRAIRLTHSRMLCVKFFFCEKNKRMSQMLSYMW